MKVLYLYSEIGPYNVAVFRHLVDVYGASVDVVFWDKHRLTPYVPPGVANVRYFPRSALDVRKIRELAASVEPDVAYVSGWMDGGYLPAARVLKARGVPVVVGFDDQWVGTLRQRAGRILFRLWLSRCFSHAWVAGPRQYEYARRLGFRPDSIIHDMLSSDVGLFSEGEVGARGARGTYPRVFLYTGRFRRVKGIDVLAEGYARYRQKNGQPWDLICIGNGDSRGLLEGQPGITVRDYLPQADLASACRFAGAFVLPSRHEPWGVVVHEFAAAGLPLLLSRETGASDVFLIDGYNGYRFEGGSSDALAEAMGKMAGLPVEALLRMGERSRKLAARIDPETSAANLVSVIPSVAREKALG